MESINDFTFSDLADSEEFAELHKIISDFTGVPMVLSYLDTASKQLGKGKRFGPAASDFGPLCQLIRTTAQGCQRCRETDTFHINQAVREGKGEHYICHAGMVDFAVPIVIQNKIIGIINCGQIFSEPPTEEGFLALKERVADLQLEEATLRKAYFATSYMSQEKIDSMLKLLSFFSKYFYEVGMRLRESQADRKYPEIAKAKDFIKDQFREMISLRTVADHVALSEAYLSRLFHRIEGVTFSHYLQVVRVEEAKKLLLKTDWSITQIAFSVGFNSLSYFNRFFKNLEDCTPRQYREKHAE